VHCPACGHELSAWTPPDPTRTERSARWVADHVTSWWFPVAVAVLLVVWVVGNVVWEPFQPYPVIVFAVTSAVLATLAALQGPLILTAQRRAATRDRQRDDETLRVAMHNERDLHRLEQRLEEILRQLEREER